ncbi:MAG TPA: FkbM family methyltransferase [Opitutus sp.]|nr:FkbM family methyltransferase [Opitutus sp.]
MNRTLMAARRLRHAPGLAKLESLWRLLRPVYRRLADPFGRGVRIELGGRPVRVPVELLSTNPDWSRYEYETFTALGAWLDATPGRLTMLDIGCSFGVLTSFAMQTSPRLEVLAFDSDLVSLRALEAVVPVSCHARLRRVDGLLGSEHRSGFSLDAAVAATLRRLPDLPPRDAIMRSGFLCFGEAAAATTPQHRLDSLLGDLAFPGPVLLKCDVEGAELLVLDGASALLRRVRPSLLLSVHPPLLPRFDRRLEDVAAFLQHHGYTWRVLARDHEEHWWCEPSSR